MKLAVLLVASLVSISGCSDKKSNAAAAKQTETTGSATGSAAAGATGSADIAAAGSAIEPGKIDESYVPAEHKTGDAKWRDIGVYHDGQPVGFLNFGELPISLKPVFVEDEVSINKPPDCPECPDRKKSSMRYYRFTEYMKSVGIDIKKVKMIHVLAPKDTQTIAATGDDLRSPAAKDFMFRFGGLVDGKALPHTPEGFGNGETPDKIMGVMIYSKRKPPEITRAGIELDGVPQINVVPYYGEPLRGGVRVYLDDKLATVVKRQELDVKLATQRADGELEWTFGAWLKSKGVDTKKVVEGWIVRAEKRVEKIPWAELEKLTFTASSQKKGEINLGPKAIPAHAIALHSRPIKDEELPKIRPDEEW